MKELRRRGIGWLCAKGLEMSAEVAARASGRWRRGELLGLTAEEDAVALMRGLDERSAMILD